VDSDFGSKFRLTVAAYAAAAVCGPDLPLISRSTNGSDSITAIYMY
jgi:hypothetical protein